MLASQTAVRVRSVPAHRSASQNSVQTPCHASLLPCQQVLLRLWLTLATHIRLFGTRKTARLSCACLPAQDLGMKQTI